MNMKSSSDDSSSSPSYPPPPLTSSPLYIARKAKEILASRDVTELTNLVTNLCYEKENDESSKLLYKCFTKHFPNLLATKLLQVYRFTTSPRPKIRSFSLSLLDSLLIDLEESRVGLNTKALGDIKEHLNACLVSQETSEDDFKLLSRIISRVAVDSFIENIPWHELSSYIISLHEEDDHKKTLLIFSELPMVLDEDFLMPLLENDLHVKILKGLLDPSSDEEWCLALEAGFNMALQLISLQRKDLVFDMVYAIVKSVLEMANVRKRKILVRKGLMRIVRKVRREALRFREAEYEVVSRFALMMMRIDGVGKVTEMAAKMIHHVLDRYYMGGGGLDWGFIQTQTGFNFA
ncbi:unnamed protein product [Arabis nemorensis]|uniref:DUF577 domain-containing protein n=1 Tax=Arabis nemorensis TaxID=586526 RepID=A0A565AXU1_9BRAS|nr:unnamed protein product [Arabis nemorensis]